MSKYSKIECKKQIPLKYNDKIRASNRNWTRVEVTLKQSLISLIEISGEFPTFISSISKDVKLNGIDIKVGDNIMSINGQNVSRASAKSVKKILKSSNSVTIILSRPDEFSLSKLLNSQMGDKQSKFNSFLNLFRKNLSCTSTSEPRECNKNIYVEESVNQCYTCGYYSIPRTNTATASSVSSTSDLGSNVDFKEEINEFLSQIQQAIENYVRPSIMFKVLTIDESLILFQNVEKLIPVTKFLDNLINSIETNSNYNTSLKIVFDAFKVYLNGLPQAVNLLEDLTISNDKFVKFIDNIGEVCSFKIMDFLFMPLKFIQSVIDYLKQFETIDCQFINDMCLSIQITYQILEENFESFSITQVTSDYSDFYSSDLESASQTGIISVLVKSDGSNQWEEADLNMKTNQIEYSTSPKTIDLSQVTNTKQSKNELIFLIQTTDQQYYAVKFASEELRNQILSKLAK
ncbi:unnamed protein product [Brachionus calyciflorus]|uniref:PDZ domain-containing protein n=1 Tax=Brachionus calyciflorus TaxID=104777 RepID=A0A814JXK3_9BILA|nr:unnamed protein product [Brachionus calyciflorus]